MSEERRDKLTITALENFINSGRVEENIKRKTPKPPALKPAAEQHHAQAYSHVISTHCTVGINQNYIADGPIGSQRKHTWSCKISTLCYMYRLLPRKVCNISFVARGVDVCPRRSQGQHSSPRATKLMLHAFLGSNLLVSFYFAAMASFKVTNCLKAHVTSLLLHTLCI